ncbi:MAG TPA: biotin--[acetyl-CoA-carboxylase] ligase [bacterium]|nr:biotin--[acetyl-CoA-carboxylase] ligase [bacterium]
MDEYTSERLAGALDTRRIGRRLRWYRTLPSTNDVAMRLADLGEPEGVVIVAEEQTAGRGRLGRAWASPRGGVWLSVILRPGLAVSQVPLVGLATAVAAARAIGESTGLAARVKWPNDVLVRGAKVVGILSETGSGAAWVVLGVGINANVPRVLLPKETGYPVTSLAECSGGPVDRVGLVRTLLCEIEKAYDALQDEGAGPVLTAWRELSETIGRVVRVHGATREFEGLATDVDADGALLVRLPDGRVERVVAGEVTVRGRG